GSATAVATAIGMTLYAEPKITSALLKIDWLCSFRAYRVTNVESWDAVQSEPVLKKYGDLRPLFSVKSPNFNTFCSRKNSIASCSKLIGRHVIHPKRPAIHLRRVSHWPRELLRSL